MIRHSLFLRGPSKFLQLNSAIKRERLSAMVRAKLAVCRCFFDR